MKISAAHIFTGIVAIVLFGCTNAATGSGPVNQIYKNTVDFGDKSICLIKNNDARQQHIVLFYDDGDRIAASLRIPAGVGKAVVLNRNAAYTVSLDGNKRTEPTDTANSDYNITIESGGRIKWDVIGPPPPPVTLAFREKANPSLRQGNPLAEGGIYKISLFNEKNLPASDFKAVITSPQGRPTEFSGLRKAGQFVESEFLPNDYFQAGKYKVSYTIAGVTVDREFTAADSDTRGPEVIGLPSRAEYRVGGNIDLVFQAKDDLGIQHASIVQMSIGSTALSLDDVQKTPPAMKRINRTTFELTFSVPFPERDSGKFRNTKNDLVAVVEMFDNPHKSGRQLSSKKSFTLKAIAGERQKFTLKDLSAGADIAIANAFVFYNSNSTIDADGHIKSYEIRNLFVASKPYKTTDAEGSVTLENISAGQKVSFVIELPDGSGYVKQVSVQRPNPSSSILVEFDKFGEESSFDFSAKYFAQKLSSENVREVRLYMISFPFEDDIPGSRDLGELESSARELDTYRVSLDEKGNGRVSFSPHDFSLSYGSGVVYKLEIEGTTADGHPLILKTKNYKGAYIGAMKTLELEEE
jgi:hypothetical protein